MTAHATPAPALTPKRRQWCRQNLRGFAEYQDAVAAADENAERAKRIAEGLSTQADEERG